ncbi:MAG: acyl carrier protein [Atopobiaceae bacterium]|jgi:acyl carrier protein|nr:acyl carrier protein [Atopobiaceae bacterium]MCH4120475.1 acyl carrier protein [Atopobiaceae bacterium]MCI1388313.1 acyl carrier protein [Atopobiaceae bacterium]MCI1431437.1 acyl carrier protein [Atopobiaceae bacterium]MCI1469873.1 acyl carrier protein [Atopobiaceae bacterium]
MDHQEILDKVTEIVSQNLEVDESEISEDTSFDDLGADSFDKLELVTAFEDEFGLTLDDESLEKIQTIGDAVEAIAQAQ